MRHPSLPLLALVVFLAACGDQPVVAPAAPETGESRAAGGLQDRYIVVFRAGVASPDELTDQLLRASGGQEHFRYRHALRGFAATLPTPALEGIRRNPNVEFIELDGEISIVTTQTNATWGIDRVDQRGLPLSGTYTYDVSGSGVRAYIIDTGIRSTHVEFSGRMGVGYTAISDGGGTEDCNGHGTHVAGTVGGTVYGVAKGVVLHPVRVLSCNGSGSVSGVVAGVDWVTGNAMKPAVANMSLGGGASTALDNAVSNSIASGVTYAVAAGNSNANACNYSPARVAAALTTGATTSSDARASYSNFGSCVDIFAPGSSIRSAYYLSNTSTATLSGTSMAAPHVAGVAALYLSTSGNAGASASQVKQAILAGATPGVVTNAGSGSPNRLLYSLLGGGGDSPNQPPSASFTYSCSDLSCTFNGSGSFDPDGSISAYQWAFGDGATATGVGASRTYGSAGTYTVLLTVTDNSGATGSASQSVTVTAPPPPPPGETVVRVGALSSSVSQAGPNWRATVATTVVDQGGNPVGGATVSASWSTGGTGSCTTASSGTCQIQGAMLKSNVSSTTFSVTGISGSGMTYDPSGNVQTSLAVARP